MGVIETLILTTALAGVGGTGLGGLIGAMLEKDSKRTVSLLLSFAGGVMLSVVCFDLITESIETGVGVLTVIASIAIGVAVIYLLNNWIPRSAGGIGRFTAFFVAGYALVWVFIYLVTKRKTDRINQTLQNQTQ